MRAPRWLTSAVGRRAAIGCAIGGAVASLAILSGCYASHGRDVGEPGGEDGGRSDAGPPVPCVEGAACSDADTCTVNDRCSLGFCRGRPMVCADPPPCAGAGACVDGACAYPPLDGAACDDGDACTSDDRCRGGACVGELLRCDDPAPARCVDPGHIEETLAPGACEEGLCTYRSEVRPCADGCIGDACACIPSGWRGESIDRSADVGRTSSIATDRDGGVHVAYYVAPPTGDLAYAYRPAGGTWVHETAVSAGDRGGSPSIALGADGRVHVVFDDLGQDELWYAVRDASGAWDAERIPASGRAFSGSLVLDPADVPHVAFTVETSRLETHLGYAVRTGGAWSSEIVAAGDRVGRYPSFAIDVLGGQHIVHVDATSQRLLHQYRAADAGGWAQQEIGDHVDGGSAIAADRTGGVHVAYFTSAPERLRYLFRSRDGDWSLEPVDGASNARWNMDLVVDPYARVHLLFDSDTPELYHALRSASGAWAIDVVASTGFSLSFLGGATMAVDARGDLHVSHYDERSRELRHVERRVCP